MMQYPACTIDAEVYPNFACIGVRDMATGAVRQFTSEPEAGEPFAAWREHWRQRKTEQLWIGFNSLAYDNHIIRAILQGADTEELYKLSLSRIADTEEWANRLEQIDDELSIDLFQLHGGKNARIASLKEIGVKLGYPVLQELPYPYDMVLSRAQMVEVMRYNVHDLNITALAADASDEHITQRIELSVEMGARVINKHDAGVVEAIMGHVIFGNSKRDYPSSTSWRLQGKDVVPCVSFVDPALQALRDRIAQWDLHIKVVEVEESGKLKKALEGTHISEAVNVGGKEFVIGRGGLHSVDEPGIWEADAEHRLLDMDVRSFYPSIIENYRLVPQHLPASVFLKAFGDLKRRRLQAKDQGRKALADGLKISINSVFGKTGSAYGWLTDPTVLLRCTIIGQLTLLSFVDLLQVERVDIVSVNTDGIVFRVHRAIAEDVITACQEWARRLGYELDWMEYTRIARRAINDYAALCADGTVKAKGAYAYSVRDLGKKATNRLAVDAAVGFLMHGIPIEQTVTECEDLAKIIDYFKCNRGYHIEDAQGVSYGGIARWYITRDGGEHLDKVKADGGRTKLVERGAKVVNRLPTDYPADVDLEHYVALAEKLVKAITEPELRQVTTVARANWSQSEIARHQSNYDCTSADPERCQQIDLPHDAWSARVKGSGYDTMKHLLVRLWLSYGGRLSRGDLTWCAKQLDEADGYFATPNMQRTLSKMIEWIARDVSPFRLPVSLEETIERAWVWVSEHVEPLKRQKRQLSHRSATGSDYVNGEALRRFAKTRDDFRLACSVCAVLYKHGRDKNVALVKDVITDVQKYFSDELETNE